MKYLLQARDVGEEAEIQMLKAGLEELGIPCLVRNENLAMARGEIPISECFPELWILNDGDFAKAFTWAGEWRDAKHTSRIPWVCPNCHETLEGQFTSCWQCGTETTADKAS